MAKFVKRDARHSKIRTRQGRIYADDVITVVDYDPEWPGRFDGLRQEYAAAMDAAGVAWVAIEHVGSTSVPRLAAKPIIDCDIVVAEEDVSAATEVLIGLGFAPLRARRPATMGLQGACPTGWNKHLRDSRGLPLAAEPSSGERDVAVKP